MKLHYTASDKTWYAFCKLWLPKVAFYSSKYTIFTSNLTHSFDNTNLRTGTSNSVSRRPLGTISSLLEEHTISINSSDGQYYMM